MNKFRNGLHSAFFNIEKRDLGEQQESLNGNEGLVELRSNVAQKEFTRIAESVAIDERNNSTREDRDRLRKRLTEKPNWSTESYKDIWEKKINEWWGHLLMALNDNHYFDNKNKEEETKKIKEQYMKEVKKQYRKNIMYADDKKFNSAKDTIFGRDSKEDYPANKIYKDLTWAASIFKVDRVYTEWYGSDILWELVGNEPENKGENTETYSDKQNRKFLSNELTKYLWDIRKAPWVVFDVAQWLIPIFNAKVDRPSKEDRKAISKFLETSTKISVEWKDPAVKLLEVFHDNRLNTDSTPAKYAEILNAHWIKLKKDKYLDDVVEAWRFYISTQNTSDSVKDQHAIYLSVLKIVETEWWANNVTNKFKSIVEQAKKDKKAEEKQWYEKWESLEKSDGGKKLKALATKLWILDLTNVSRLNALESDYFSKTAVEQILANLNNDKTIDARDTMAWWLKSWKQFLEIFHQVGKERALPNLLKHAGLLNKTLGLGLDESKFTEGEIKSWNKELILLLQNIINKPWEDLITLLSGHTENPFEGIDLDAAKQWSEEEAKKIISKMKRDALEKEGLNLPTPESMQSWLAATLYSEYTRWVWLWSKISFDEWIKWLEMNTWFQIRNGWEVVVWIGLDYKKKIWLWKWWSTSPELSAWAFIPLWYGRPEVTPSVWLNNEVAKEWITKKWIKEHLWVQWGVTLMPAWVVIASVWLNWNRDKLAWIEAREQEMKSELNKEMKDVLGKIYEKRKMIKSPYATKLNFGDATLVKTIKEELEDKVTKLWVKEKDKETVVNATMRLLTNYSNRDLHQEAVRDLIAQKVSEQYAMSWAEARKSHITESAYLSWANLGVFWTVGAPLVWIYAGVKVTKHRLDWYGDRWWREYELGHDYDGKRSPDMLSSFNQELWLSGNESIKLNEQWLIVIPSSLKHRVNVNKKLSWLMKKWENGEILLHPQTPMAADIKRWAATQWSEIVIWWSKWWEYVKLDTIWDNRFTSEEINQDRILELGEGISTYNVDVLNKALNELKQKLPWNPFKDFDFTKYQKTEELIAKLNNLDKKKKAKLLIVNNNGNLEIKDPVESTDGRWLEIEYQSNFEMIDSKAKEVANAVYAEALKVKNPKALHAVKHQPWAEYKPFNDAMVAENYEAAKNAIKPIFTALDKQISWVNFTDVWKKLDGIQDRVALWQALMSINNIFARSRKVRGWNDKYEFKGRDRRWREIAISMWSIIKERESQIKSTIQDKISDVTVRQGYVSLIDASAKYREQNPTLFSKTSDKAKQLDNTIWFNLWDKTNPENPLFNPEIYSSVVDLKSLENLGFDEQKKNALHERAMRLFAGNEALRSPFLKALWLEWQTVKIEEFKSEWEKWKLKLDIWWKKVTLSAWMNFGYFTQCVNHTVILDNISAETEDWTSVSFNSGVWENWRYIEGDKSSVVSTTEVRIGGAIVSREGEEGNSKVKTDDATTWGVSPTTTPSGTTENPQPPTPAWTGTDDIWGGNEI